MEEKEKTQGEARAATDGPQLPPDHPLAKAFGSRRGDLSLDRLEQRIALYRRNPNDGSAYPLRGKPLSCDSPFDSVAEEDWDAVG